MRIDLNCDMGESFGAYQLGQDEAVLPWVTSANIACGFHAGDPLVMERTVRLALQHRAAVGAHPGYPDLQGFGRRNMDFGVEEIEAMVLYQIGALAGIVKARGGELVHVKPHGALYNQAAASLEVSAAIARAVASYSRELVLVGLAGSRLVEAGEAAGLRVANEAFPDRAYNPDGSLRSRKLPGAVLEDPQAVSENALHLAQAGIAITAGSQNRVIPVDTLCLHGDNPSAGENARQVRQALEVAGLRVEALAVRGDPRGKMSQ